MRVLVIGGTGFIGPHLVSQLCELGHEVAVFQRGQSRAELPQEIKHFLGDRERMADSAGELRGFGPQVIIDMIAYFEEHARTLLDVFRGVSRRVVVISSGDVYRAYGLFHGSEDGPLEPVPLVEDAPLRAVLHPYRKNAQGPDDFAARYDKIPVEHIVMSDRDMHGTVLRLPMVYGPGDRWHRLFPYLKRMDDARPKIVLNEGMAQWRCPRGYVENVAAAIALAATDDRALGRIYNVAETPAYNEADWVRKIGAAVDWKGELLLLPRERMPVSYRTEQHIETDSTRIRTELGYREPVPPLEALRRTILWERSHPPEQNKIDYTAEDALLADLKMPSDTRSGQG